MYSPYASTNLGSVGAPAVGNLGGLESINIGTSREPLTAGGVRSLGQGRTFSATQAFTTPLTLGVSREMTMAQRAQAAQQQVQNMLAPMGERAKQVQRAIQNNPGRLGMGLAALPALGTAVSEAQQGRPIGAAGAVAGGGFGAALGLGASALLPAPLRGAARAVLPTVGALMGAPSGAQAAEYAKRKVTGEPTKGKEGELGSQLAARGKIAAQDLDLRQQMLGQNLAATKDLTQFYMQAELQQLQAMNPTIQKMKNADLVRQQAMANTMAGNYAMLGTVATAGKLATGAQAEAGANLRTALTANPYAGSVMQAPNISFG
jgi:hypothetical protein